MIRIEDIDDSSVFVDGLHWTSYPDFDGAMVQSADFNDGTPLTEEQLEELHNCEEFSSWLQDLILQRQLWI